MSAVALSIADIEYDQGCEFSWSGKHKLFPHWYSGPPEDCFIDGYTIYECMNGDCDYYEEE